MANRIKKYIQTRQLILLISVLFFLFRIPNLDNTFLLYDERDTVLTQYSIAKTGNDLYGNSVPLTFDHISPHAPILSMYYGVPFWIAGLEKTVSNARLIYILPFSLVPLLVFEFIYTVLKKQNIAVLTSIIFSFSPWVYHISRLALEINIAFPLFLTAIILQFKRKNLASWLFYFLTYFSYQGIRPQMFILMIYIELFYLIKHKSVKRFIKQAILFFVVFLLFFIIGIFIEKNTTLRSSSEIVLFNKFRLAQETDYKRFISQAPLLIKPIFDNKIVLSLEYIFNNFMSGLNFSYLFSTSDYVPVYSNGVTGQFFPMLFVALIFGILTLGKKIQKEYVFVAGLTFIGLTSAVLNIYSLSFSIRALLSGIGFSFVMVIGVTEFFVFLSRIPQIYKVITFCIMLTIFFYQVTTFYYRYTYQRPVWQSELYNENERSLTKYLLESDGSYIVKTNNAFAHFLSYLFLKKLQPNELILTQKALQKSKTNFSLGGVTFSECQFQEIALPIKPNNLIVEEACLTSESKKYIESKHIPYKRINYSNYNNLDTSTRMKYFVFN